MDDMTEQDLMDIAGPGQTSLSDGHGASMLFELNGTPIYVCIFPSNGSSTKHTRHLQQEDRPLQDHLIDLISRSPTCRDHGGLEKLHNELLGIILKAGKPLFSQLTLSQQPPRRGHPTLHQILFTKILYFRLEADTSPPSLVQIESSEGLRVDVRNPVLDPAFEKGLDVYGHIPWYTPEDIVVKNVLVQSVTIVIALVCVDGRDMLCQSQREPSRLRRGPESQQLECLGKILRAFPQQGSIRVPRLLGYIHDKDTKRILGFLQQWVPGRRLRMIDLAATPAETKQKWASQIRETIQLLHSQGLEWGNANPYNVVIDENDDAWLIEVEGESAQGWVDMKLIDTGDEQGLDKIARLLSGNGDVDLSS